MFLDEGVSVGPDSGPVAELVEAWFHGQTHSLGTSSTRTDNSRVVILDDGVSANSDSGPIAELEEVSPEVAHHGQGQSLDPEDAAEPWSASSPRADSSCAVVSDDIPTGSNSGSVVELVEVWFHGQTHSLGTSSTRIRNSCVVVLDDSGSADSDSGPVAKPEEVSTFCEQLICRPQVCGNAISRVQRLTRVSHWTSERHGSQQPE